MNESNRQPAQAPLDAELQRRSFLSGLAYGASAYVMGNGNAPALAKPAAPGVHLTAVEPHEDLFAYIQRMNGTFDATLYKQLLGASNEFKEGDQYQGVAAEDDTSRENARRLLKQTSIGELCAHPVYEDELSKYINANVDTDLSHELAEWTLGDLHRFLLASDESRIKRILPGLFSDVIACVVKVMSDEDVIAVGSKVYNALPDTKIGARGYLGARIQPNSPTDNVEDIQWQVFNGFSFAVGDALLGTNPVSSEVQSVMAIELALAEILETFELQDVMPHCVLAHVDVQADVEQWQSGATALWFQSLAGVEDANETFDISVAKMIQHASTRTGKYGMYFETGQGADATNGHGKGFDMLIHESRKYGFARALTREVALAQQSVGIHWPRDLPHARTVGPLLPRGHRHGKAPRPDDWARHLFDASHGSQSRRFGLVHRADHARGTCLSHGAAYEERPYVELSDHRFSGSCPRP